MNAHTALSEIWKDWTGDGEEARNAAHDIIAALKQKGFSIVPTDPTHNQIRAMSESRAQDDEGEFPPMLDLLDFSGENKTHTVLRAAYVAAIGAGTKGKKA